MTTPKVLTRDETRDACKFALDWYVRIWGAGIGGFWTFSNQMMSYLQFAEACTAAFGSDNPPYNYYQLVSQSNSEYLARYSLIVQSAIADKSLWTDDFGWGGIACLKLAEYLKKNNRSDWVQYRNFAYSCLDRMVTVSKYDIVKYTSPVSKGLSNYAEKPGMADDKYWKNTGKYTQQKKRLKH